MRRLFAIVLAASLILVPYAPLLDAEDSAPGPPIEQPLVSEGEFAVELANALNLDSSHDEATAENSLATVNIAPGNGWISNYPMTPDIISEVRDSAARSASAGSLNMSEADVTSAVDSVSQAMNLPVRTAGDRYAEESGSSSSSSSFSSSSSSEYQSSASAEYQSNFAAPPPEGQDYEGPGAIDEYYDEYGPPVVTYYPPPWDYAYLYDWVPYPFWWGGFGFGGFFILCDFGVHHHHHWISNHVTNANGRVSRVNAVTRATGGTSSSHSSTLAGTGGSTSGSGFSSANAQAGARSILNRQTGSTAASASTSSTNPGNPASRGPSDPASSSRGLSSSGSPRNMANAGGSTRNPVSVARDLDRTGAFSGSRMGTVSRSAASMSPSFNGRTFSGAGSARNYGGSRSSGSFAGYRTNGGFGSSRSGGGGFGGFHGGGMGGHGGGGHR